MPRTVNPYMPVGQFYSELGRGNGFAPKDERQGSPKEAAAADAWQELAMAWAAGFHLARRLGKLDEFEDAVLYSGYYCPWAVMAIEMPGYGLVGFLRIGVDEGDGGAGLYRKFFRLARGFSNSTQRGFQGPDQPFLLTEAVVSRARFADAVYDERVIFLARQFADLLICAPIREQMDLDSLQVQHRLLVQAYIDEFATIRLDAKPGARSQMGVRRLLSDMWRSLSDTQQTQLAWIKPLVSGPTRKAEPEAPANTTP